MKSCMCDRRDRVRRGRGGRGQCLWEINIDDRWSEESLRVCMSVTVSNLQCVTAVFRHSWVCVLIVVCMVRRAEGGGNTRKYYGRNETK